MTHTSRIYTLNMLFKGLMSTNSRKIKDDLLKHFLYHAPEIQVDWEWIMQILANTKPAGYTVARYAQHYTAHAITPQECTLEQYFSHLWHRENNSDEAIIAGIKCYDAREMEFIQPIIDRTLRLGITAYTQCETPALAPMLAVKYPECPVPFPNFVTQKLDGNRAIAHYEEGAGWLFTSRSIKPLVLPFDLSHLDKKYIYDGEVITRDKWNNVEFGTPVTTSLGETAGLVNRKSGDKSGAVYAIFDLILPDVNYSDRRELLNSFMSTESVKILPTLAQDANEDRITELLAEVTDKGGEGLMVNAANEGYGVGIRDFRIVKVKKMQTMDMLCIGVAEGAGRNAGKIGKLICEITTDKGMHILTGVGSGLHDEDRAKSLSEFVGKVIEVQYFAITQDKTKKGTNEYSLQFPIFKKIRTDKNTTSEY